MGHAVVGPTLLAVVLDAAAEAVEVVPTRPPLQRVAQLQMVAQLRMVAQLQMAAQLQIGQRTFPFLLRTASRARRALSATRVAQSPSRPMAMSRVAEQIQSTSSWTRGRGE